MGKILSSISSCQVWILQCHLEVLILQSGANFIFALGDDLASTTVKKLFQRRKTKVRLTEQVRGRGMPEFLESSFMLYSGILVTRALSRPAFPQQIWSLTIILTQFNSILPRVHGNLEKSADWKLLQFPEDIHLQDTGTNWIWPWQGTLPSRTCYWPVNGVLQVQVTPKKIPPHETSS